jgi:hypothetical protein
MTTQASASIHGRHGKHTRKSAPIAHASPAPTMFSGQIILTYPVKGNYKYLYGILKVDGAGCSVSSTTPLRFDLDTRSFPNGRHALMVSIFDDGGLVQEFVPFTVIIANGTTDSSSHLQFIDYPKTATVDNAKPPTIYFNKMKMNFDIPPYDDKDRIMVELRPLIDLTGSYLDWMHNNGSTQVNQQFFNFGLLKDQVIQDGYSIKIVRQLVERKHRVFAPVCIWRDLFGGDVEYDENTNTVTLYTLPGTPHGVPVPVSKS